MAISPAYPTTDYSQHCDLRVSAARRLSPIGSGIHTTGGVSSRHWLCSGSAKTGKPASANWLINRDGSREKLCRDDRYPYHMGDSRFTLAGQLREDNDLSQLLIGIEFEQVDDQLVTWKQLQSGAELIVKVLAPIYHWAFPYVILGHYECAIPLGRRSDPQGFDWGAFFGYIYQYQFTDK